MQGSSGIPKSDINSMAAPTTTADTNAELKNSTEPCKRQITRKPPVVKERQPAYLQGNDAKTSGASTGKKISQTPSSKESVSPPSDHPINQHTAPVVSSSRENSQMKSNTHTEANDLKEIAISLVLRIQPALIEKDLDELEIVIKGLEEKICDLIVHRLLTTAKSRILFVQAPSG